MRKVSAAHLGTCCTTWSRANTTNPYRTNAQILGLSSLSGERPETCNAANEMVFRSAVIFGWCCRYGVRCSLESPLSSMIWGHPQLRTIYLTARHGDSGQAKKLHFCLRVIVNGAQSGAKGQAYFQTMIPPVFPGNAVVADILFSKAK